MANHGFLDGALAEGGVPLSVERKGKGRAKRELAQGELLQAASAWASLDGQSPMKSSRQFRLEDAAVEYALAQGHAMFSPVDVRAAFRREFAEWRDAWAGDVGREPRFLTDCAQCGDRLYSPYRTLCADCAGTMGLDGESDRAHEVNAEINRRADAEYCAAMGIEPPEEDEDEESDYSFLRSKMESLAGAVIDLTHRVDAGAVLAQQGHETKCAALVQLDERVASLESAPSVHTHSLLGKLAERVEMLERHTRGQGAPTPPLDERKEYLERASSTEPLPNWAAPLRPRCELCSAKRTLAGASLLDGTEGYPDIPPATVSAPSRDSDVLLCADCAGDRQWEEKIDAQDCALDAARALRQTRAREQSND